ncbi:hypothetical protein ACFQJ7_15930 [Halovenus rubra]|uniref:Uncharacterized protein n=2 Tax=Halovenus rubra TaxID=869890 RepID=A0ACC7E5P8_9EURY|nr:hypothetical protein [Halovenus rubra]
MQRRQFIGAAGSTILAAVAGCISNGDDDESGGQDSDNGTPAGNESSNDTPAGGTPAGNESSNDTPAGGTPTDGDGNQPVGSNCPSFSDKVDRTVCARSETDSQIYPTISKQVFEPTTDDNTVENLQITLHNESDKTFGLNPYAWALKRQTDDGWSHVAPEAYIQPWENVESGGRYNWNLSVEKHPTPSEEQTVWIAEDLESGTYAFQITGMASTESDDDGPRIECVAQFEIKRD